MLNYDCFASTILNRIWILSYFIDNENMVLRTWRTSNKMEEDLSHHMSSHLEYLVFQPSAMNKPSGFITLK